jgi:predicted DNA-binding transcriptional regulator YafY
MAKSESISQLYTLLKKARYPLSKQTLKEKLECSDATVERYLEILRDTYSLNIEYKREYNGYKLEHDPNNEIELPSHLFTAQEVNAILLIEQIINDLEPSFLKEDTQAVKQHLSKIKEKFAGKKELESHRIRMINIGKRSGLKKEQGIEKENGTTQYLSQVTQAVLQQKQITLQYNARSSIKATDKSIKQAPRKLSPQRLTHYRDNWYLDAWCHQKNALRTFAIERIQQLKTHQTNSKEISSKELDDYYTPSFGIFGGKVQHIAILKFTPQRSQWVSEEIWHHKQKGIWLEDGSYQLEIPYGNDLELIGDILKYGDQVEVIAPQELRQKIMHKIKNLTKIYQSLTN